MCLRSSTGCSSILTASSVTEDECIHHAFRALLLLLILLLLLAFIDDHGIGTIKWTIGIHCLILQPSG